MQKNSLCPYCGGNKIVTMQDGYVEIFQATAKHIRGEK